MSLLLSSSRSYAATTLLFFQKYCCFSSLSDTKNTQKLEITFEIILKTRLFLEKTFTFPFKNSLKSSVFCHKTQFTRESGELDIRSGV